MPDIETSEYYIIDKTIYKNIIDFIYPSEKKLKFYIAGYDGAEYFWNENSDKRIQYFSYKSLRFIDQEILLSHFRMKFFDTFLFLPYSNNYHNFDERVANTLETMHKKFDFDLQKIDFNLVKDKDIQITKIVDLVKLKTHIYKTNY